MRDYILSTILLISIIFFGGTNNGQSVVYSNLSNNNQNTEDYQNLLDEAEQKLQNEPLSSIELLKNIVSAQEGEIKIDIQAYANYLTGNAYAILGIFDQSLAHTEKALNQYKTIGNIQMTVRLLNNMGNLYWNYENYETAFSFYWEAFSKTIQHNIEDNLAPTTMNVGLAHSHLGNIDSALFYYHKAMKIVKDNENEFGLGIVSYNIGSLYFMQNEYDSAIAYFNIVEKYKSHFNNILRSSYFSEVARTYSKTKNFKLASVCLDSSKIIADKQNSFPALKDYYLAKYEFDSAQGNLHAAMQSYALHFQYQDSVRSESFENKLAAYQIRYQLDKKEADLNELEQNNALTSKKIKNQRLIITTVLLALIIISILSIRLLYFLKTTRKYKNLFKEKNKKLSHKNTSLLKSEKELKELNDSKNKLFSIIAHDIKSPLYAMIRMADVLIDKYELHDDEKRKNYIRLLNQSGKELINLTENLLGWSRYQIGNIPYRPTYFPFIESINFAMGISQHLAEQKDIEIIIKVPETAIVFADFSMTSTIIRNIINNAVKFTPQNGEIIITLKDFLDYVKIEFSDTGIGMDSKTKENVFKIEEKISRPGTAGEKGSGLGLALCKEFVERNNGDIGVNSTEGKGSTFWFTLSKQKIET